MADINTGMRDWLLRNQHFVHRYENGTIQELVRPYNKAKVTIVRRLAELDLAPAPGRTQFTKQWRIQRLQNILGEVNKTLELAALEGVESLATRVNDLAFIHADALYDEMAGRMNTVGIAMNQLPLEQVLHIAEKPMLGEILLRDDITDRLLWGNQQAVQQIRNQLTQGIMLGDDMGKISRRLVGVGEAFGGEVGKKIQNRAKIIARTEVQRVSNAVTKNFYDANQDVIKGVMYTATLDRRTCLQCSPLDGRVYYYSGAVRGVRAAMGIEYSVVLEQFSETGDLAPALPQHPLCRCTYAPVTKSWKELGLDIKDAPPGTRASLTGQIPSTVTYGQWLTTQPEAFQLEVLGPTRFKMWKEGKIRFTEMARDGRIVSVEDLQKLIARRPLPVEPVIPKP
ncbi:MAG: phage minor head protein, partial [Candidatus Thorarchaeota archaeon]